MYVIDLCSGIGGLTLGYMPLGWRPHIFCEKNAYCQQILQLRFGNIPILKDIADVTARAFQSLGVSNTDLGIVAGLPCPAFSLAGKRLASKDERDIFPEFFRIVREIRPRWCVIENVPGLLYAESGEFFISVLREFAALGYDAEWRIISAASVGAVHLRERVFIIAYTNSEGERKQAQRCKPEQRYTSHPQSQYEAWGNQEQKGANLASECGSVAPKSAFESVFCSSNDGFSTRLDGYLLRQQQLKDWLNASSIPSVSRLSSRQVATLSPDERAAYREAWREYQLIRKQHIEAISALGNAVVPQIAVEVFKRLKEILEKCGN